MLADRWEGLVDAVLPHWWLSFCDPRRPRGKKFVGACIVEGRNIAEAARTAWAMGCNPGGEIMGYELPHRVASRLVGRLIGAVEADALTRTVADWPAEEEPKGASGAGVTLFVSYPEKGGA